MKSNDLKEDKNLKEPGESPSTSTSAKDSNSLKDNKAAKAKGDGTKGAVEGTTRNKLDGAKGDRSGKEREKEKDKGIVEGKGPREERVMDGVKSRNKVKGEEDEAVETEKRKEKVKSKEKEKKIEKEKEKGKEERGKEEDTDKKEEEEETEETDNLEIIEDEDGNKDAIEEPRENQQRPGSEMENVTDDDRHADTLEEFNATLPTNEDLNAKSPDSINKVDKEDEVKSPDSATSIPASPMEISPISGDGKGPITDNEDSSSKSSVSSFNDEVETPVDAREAINEIIHNFELKLDGVVKRIETKHLNKWRSMDNCKVTNTSSMELCYAKTPEDTEKKMCAYARSIDLVLVNVPTDARKDMQYVRTKIEDVLTQLKKLTASYETLIEKVQFLSSSYASEASFIKQVNSAAADLDISTCSSKFKWYKSKEIYTDYIMKEINKDKDKDKDKGKTQASAKITLERLKTVSIGASSSNVTPTTSKKKKSLESRTSVAKVPSPKTTSESSNSDDDDEDESESSQEKDRDYEIDYDEEEEEEEETKSDEEEEYKEPAKKKRRSLEEIDAKLCTYKNCLFIQKDDIGSNVNKHYKANHLLAGGNVPEDACVRVTMGKDEFEIRTKMWKIITAQASSIRKAYSNDVKTAEREYNNLCKRVHRDHKEQLDVCEMIKIKPKKPARTEGIVYSFKARHFSDKTGIPIEKIEKLMDENKL